jgi:tetratricopeptide (TPR) repeat protein
MRFPNRIYSQILALGVISLSCLSLFAVDQYPKRRLNARVVAALVAGGSLPEGIAADVRDNGLNFHPSERYISRLTQIGANAVIIDALKKANVIAAPSVSHPDDPVVLEHLFVAGEKLKAKKLMEAATELSAASDNLEEHPELAFVMGEIMRQEESFEPAVRLYSKLIEIDSEFPEAHTKLSFVLYRNEDAERGVAEARAAIARTPDSAEAHKCMGQNLEAQKQFDAAIAEYQRALAIKPDYIVVHFDLGILYLNRGDYRNSIAESRKALASDPTNADAHYNLALALENTGEFGTAMGEFREAIRLKPNKQDWRIKLAELMSNAGDRDGAIEEFRKVIRMSPDASYCHNCFGNLLYHADRLDEAARQYRIALQLDASDADSHYGLGLIYEAKNQPDEAFKEFQEAARLGMDSWGVHQELANIYFARKQNDEALTEIKQALSIAPSNGYIHEKLADILAASGRDEEAISEYRQAVQLQGHDSKQASDIERKLGALYEKIGNYSVALSFYRGMYESFPNEKNKAEYEADRNRLSSRVPKSVLAEDSNSAANDPQALMARWVEKSREMQQAMVEKRWKDADAAGKEAIAFAEQMQPQDARLIGSMGLMAMSYQMQNRDQEAEKQFLNTLQTSEKLLGTTNVQTMFAESAIGRFYFQVKNYPQAVEYLSRSFDTAQKLYGPTYGFELLDMIGQAYAEQRKFDKAEDAYKRNLAADETKNGPSSPSSAATLEHLGVLYCDMGKFTDAQSALERVVAMDQKQYGQNSPSLDRPLNELARALRGLGKEDEAKALDQRRALLAQNQTH